MSLVLIVFVGYNSQPHNNNIIICSSWNNRARAVGTHFTLMVTHVKLHLRFSLEYNYCDMILPKQCNRKSNSTTIINCDVHLQG